MQDPDKISLNFILSTGRTGSTLLTTMLNMHPQMLSTFEEPFAYNLYQKYNSKTDWDDQLIKEFCYDFYLFSEGKLEPQFGKKEDLIKILTAHKSGLTGAKAIKLAYFAFLPNKDKSEVTVVIDKQVKIHPVLSELITFYPKSKFIVLYRDARDNSLVKYKRSFKQKRKRSLYYFAKIWNHEYKILNRETGKISSERVLKIKYEELVENPEKTLILISSFFKVPFDAAMLNYDEKFKENISSSSTSISHSVIDNLLLFHEGLSQKVNTKKVGVWKTELKEKEYNMIWSVCKSTLLKSGYKAENCKSFFYFRVNMLPDFLRFYITRVILPFLYYKTPYSIRYLIKKVMYNKKFKGSKWTSQTFYQKS
ncbi:MAG: Sulfotransferase domain protein [Bacteroidota bacterium]|jgi:hypothetical protein|nr:Sulfotransferase domain protein [Bacteroidota bacterium]